MTFKLQANEEQCYLVQDEEAREWKKPQPQYKKEKVAPTKHKADSLITTMRKHWEQDKVSSECHQAKKSKPINKDKGEKKTKIKNTPAKSLTDFIAIEENKEGVVSEGSIVRVFHSGTGRAQDQLSNQRSSAHGLMASPHREVNW
jgi:hypothetical protein